MFKKLKFTQMKYLKYSFWFAAIFAWVLDLLCFTTGIIHQPELFISQITFLICMIFTFQLYE